MADRIVARSVVRLTIEVQHIGGHWGDDCTIAQAHKQAATCAVNVVEAALLNAKEGSPRIVEVACVDVVVSKEKQR